MGSLLEFNVHPNQIANGNKQFLDNKPLSIFQEKDSRVTNMNEKEENLFKKHRKQQGKLDFLEKISSGENPGEAEHDRSSP